LQVYILKLFCLSSIKAYEAVLMASLSASVGAAGTLTRTLRQSKDFAEERVYSALMDDNAEYTRSSTFGSRIPLTRHD
jgi:hypothetical protein